MRNFKFAVPSKAMCGCLLYECGTAGISNTRYGPPMNRRVAAVCARVLLCPCAVASARDRERESQGRRATDCEDGHRWS